MYDSCVLFLQKNQQPVTQRLTAGRFNRNVNVMMGKSLLLLPLFLQCTDNNLPLDTTMSQMSPVHILLNQLLGTESLFSSQFSSACQEILRVFCNSNSTCLCQVNPVHTVKSYVFETLRNIVSHLRLDLTICLFPLGFPTKLYMCFTRPFHSC